MAKTTTVHNRARSPNRSAQYPVRRNGVIYIVVKSHDNKQEV
jgi:hypothetical protein